jgi:hypothetical protein
MALFGIVERLSAAGMGAALEEAARVWTPPAPGAGIRGVRMPAGVGAPAHTARC